MASSSVNASEIFQVRVTALGCSGITVDRVLNRDSTRKYESSASLPDNVKAIAVLSRKNQVIGVTPLSSFLRPSVSQDIDAESKRNRMIALWTESNESSVIAFNVDLKKQTAMHSKFIRSAASSRLLSKDYDFFVGLSLEDGPVIPIAAANLSLKADMESKIYALPLYSVSQVNLKIFQSSGNLTEEKKDDADTGAHRFAVDSIDAVLRVQITMERCAPGMTLPESPVDKNNTNEVPPKAEKLTALTNSEADKIEDSQRITRLGSKQTTPFFVEERCLTDEISGTGSIEIKHREAFPTDGENCPLSIDLIEEQCITDEKNGTGGIEIKHREALATDGESCPLLIDLSKSQAECELPVTESRKSEGDFDRRSSRQVDFWEEEVYEIDEGVDVSDDVPSGDEELIRQEIDAKESQRSPTIFLDEDSFDEMTFETFDKTTASHDTFGVIRSHIQRVEKFVESLALPECKTLEGLMNSSFDEEYEENTHHPRDGMLADHLAGVFSPTQCGALDRVRDWLKSQDVSNAYDQEENISILSPHTPGASAFTKGPSRFPSTCIDHVSNGKQENSIPPLGDPHGKGAFSRATPKGLFQEATHHTPAVQDQESQATVLFNKRLVVSERRTDLTGALEGNLRKIFSFKRADRDPPSISTRKNAPPIQHLKTFPDPDGDLSSIGELTLTTHERRINAENQRSHMNSELVTLRERSKTFLPAPSATISSFFVWSVSGDTVVTSEHPFDEGDDSGVPGGSSLSQDLSAAARLAWAKQQAEQAHRQHPGRMLT